MTLWNDVFVSQSDQSLPWAGKGGQKAASAFTFRKGRALFFPGNLTAKLHVGAPPISGPAHTKRRPHLSADGRRRVLGRKRRGRALERAVSTFPLGYLSSSGERGVPGVGGGRYWNAGASGAGSAGTGRLPSADPPPSCSPFASVPEWDRGPCVAGRRLCRSPRTPPPWPGSLTRRRSRQYSGPREAGAAPGPPHGDRSRASRGKSPWAAAMALKMVKGIIDCMFDSNLQD
ncbi:uncharacterized protein LOC144331517 [Macaca mulatta]